MKLLKKIFSKKKSKLISIIVFIIILVGIISVREYIVYKNTVKAFSYAISTGTYAMNRYGAELANSINGNSGNEEFNQGVKLEDSKSKLDNLYNSINTFTFFNRNFKNDIITYIDDVNISYKSRDNMQDIERSNEKMISLKSVYPKEFKEAMEMSNKQ